MYQAAIFFDNEVQNITNVKNVCGTITSVHVNETPNLTQIPWNKLTDFTTRLGTNKYYDLMKKTHGGEAYDERSGIKRGHVLRYLEWEKSTRALNKRVVLVDWDRTITAVEGFMMPTRIHNNQLFYTLNKTSEYAVPMGDFLTYLCGSKERYAMMKQFFHTCIQSGVDIVVLTNNGAAADPESLPMFQTIVNAFTGVPTKIIASSISPYNYHKGAALQGSDGFDLLCIPAKNNVGGGVRIKTHLRIKGMRYSRRAQYKHTRKQRKTRRVRRAHRGGRAIVSFRNEFMNMLRQHPDYQSMRQFVQNQIDMPVLNQSFPVEYDNMYIAVIYGGEGDNTTVGPKLIVSILKSNNGIDQIAFATTNQSVEDYLESIGNPRLMPLNEIHSVIEQGISDLLLN